MIKIIIRTKKEEYIGFSSIGHAGYAESGSDIVCAAVSVLILNTVNSIEQFTSDIFRIETDEKQGVFEFEFHTIPSKEAKLLFSSMVLGISSLVEDEEYNEYLSILFEEV